MFLLWFCDSNGVIDSQDNSSAHLKLEIHTVTVNQQKGITETVQAKETSSGTFKGQTDFPAVSLSVPPT